MNGAERVFTRIRRSFGIRSYHQVDDLLGVRRGWAASVAHHGGLTDAAIIVINEATCISIGELLDLRAKKLRIAPMAFGNGSIIKPRKYIKRDRDGFEEWARNERLYTRREGESYFDQLTARCWRAWQAGRGIR